jgi:hypothetical protein
MNWSNREKKLLKKFYPQFLFGNIPRKDLIKIFNRSLEAIQHKASDMGYNKIESNKINEEQLKKWEETLDI